MTKLPVKVLLDENKKPFVPYMNTDTVFYRDSDKTVSETLDEAVGEVTALAETVDDLAKEVAAKIETVFTYKGSVSNYNALTQITNPNIGDVYNVLDTDKNYAWSGSKWDDLGGIVDLSDYCTEDRMLYIIEEHSKILGDMLTNQMNNALLEYYTKKETDKLVNDALSNAEVDVDLSDYYTKEEVDVRIPNINMTPVLKSAGHVDTVEELPDPAQPSGEFGEHPSVLNTDLTLTDIAMPNLSDLPNLQTIQGYATPYVFGFYIDQGNYFFLSVDKPEKIDGFSYSLDGHFSIYTTEGVSVDNGIAIAHANYNSIGFMDPMTGGDGCAVEIASHFIDAYLSGDDTSIQTPPPIFGTPEPAVFMHYLGGKGPVRIFGNLPTTVKYRPHLPRVFKKIGPDPLLTVAYEPIAEDATRDSLTLSFAENYTYTDGMKALRFDEQGNAYWITNEDGAKENDVATVGDSNDIYVNEPDKGWTPWAKPKDIDTSAFLKPKGFVNSEADLPSMGQPSGTAGSTLATLSTDITQIRESLEKQTSSRYMLYLDLGWDYWSPADAGVDAYLKIETDYPETIKAIGIAPSGRAVVQVHATSAKPVYINKRRIITSKTGYTWQYGSGEWSGSYTLTSDYDYNVESELVVKGIYGNLPNVLLHYPCTATMLSVNQSSGTTSRISSQNSDSVRLDFANNYIYNTGMQMLKFDPDTYQASWVLADPQEEPNVMYLVGPNNEQYISTTDRWVHVSNHDSYTKAEIDAMLGEIESVLDDILNGG